MNNEYYFTRVMERLKAELGIGTDAALARALGMSPTAYSNRKQADSIPYEQIVQVAATHGVDLHYVLSGEQHPPSPASAPGIDEELLANLLTEWDSISTEKGLDLEPELRARAIAGIYKDVSELVDDRSKQRVAARSMINRMTETLARMAEKRGIPLQPGLEQSPKPSRQRRR